LTLSPNLTTKLNYLNSSEPTLSTAIHGVKTTTEIVNIGLNKKFSTGTNLALEYDNRYKNITNADPSLISNNRTWDVNPRIKLEQPLLRDWLGKETQALINLKNSTALAQGHGNLFTKKKILADAESVYWDLATVQANIIIRQDSVKRSAKLIEWAERRLKLGLADDSDFFQAKSAHQQRHFELESFRDLQKAKARLFNAFRSIQSDDIPNTLDNFKNINLLTLKPKDYNLPPSIREDLHANYQNYKISEAKATLSAQSIKPDLTVNLLYYPAGRDRHYLDSGSDAFQGKNNTYGAGLNFSMPLDRSLIKELNNAYKAESYAAKLTYARKKFEVTNEWQRLAEQFDLFSKQLKITERIVATQLEKLKNEEKLLKNGRTTTFQVLQFEEDYFNAQSQYFDTKNKLLKLATLMKLFY
jgi:outer membrane protein TolC